MSENPEKQIHWHFLPCELELRSAAGGASDTESLQQGPLPAGAEVAILGAIKTYLYVVHIDKTGRVTPLYASGKSVQGDLDWSGSMRLPGSDGYLVVPRTGDVRVIVSQEEIAESDWPTLGLLDGREPPPTPVKRGL